MKLWNFTLSFTLSSKYIRLFQTNKQKRKPTIKTRKVVLYFLHGLTIHYLHLQIHPYLFSFLHVISGPSLHLFTCVYTVCVRSADEGDMCRFLLSYFFPFGFYFVETDLSCFGCCVAVLLALLASTSNDISAYFRAVGTLYSYTL